MQALLQSERQTAEEARKARTDSEARNAELSKKLEDAEQKVDQLQESVQRFVNTSETCAIVNYCSHVMQTMSCMSG